MKKDSEKSPVQIVAGFLLVMCFVFALLGLYQGWQIIVDVFAYMFR